MSKSSTHEPRLKVPFLFVSFCTELAYELAGGDGVWRKIDQLNWPV